MDSAYFLGRQGQGNWPSGSQLTKAGKSLLLGRLGLWEAKHLMVHCPVPFWGPWTIAQFELHRLS